jgi:nucleotide-binding universal stress UspA family protein
MSETERPGSSAPIDGARRVVVGIDTSPESLHALDWSLVLAGAFAGSVVVVHAVGLLEEGGYAGSPDVVGLVDDARERMVGSPPSTEVVFEHGPAAEVVIRVAEREHADVVVVGRRGLGQAVRLLGSVSEAVLAGSGCPVLVVTRP